MQSFREIVRLERKIRVEFWNRNKTYCGGHFTIYANIELCYTPKPNILYVKKPPKIHLTYQ